MDWVKGKPTEEHGLCPEIQSFPVEFLFIHLHPSLGIGILVVKGLAGSHPCKKNETNTPWSLLSSCISLI